jgi:hypothetical protein
VTLYKDCDLKFNIWRLYAKREIDLWMYEMYYKNDKFPNTKEKKEKRKEVLKKHKEKK